MKKRGQVTAIVIVGLLLVIAAISIYIIKTRILTSAWERERTKAEVVPEKAAKVKTYIESCIQQTLQDAITAAELQAGFVYPPQDAIPRSLANPLSNALDLFGNKNTKVPYWFYEAANGVKENQVPTVKTMQQQMEKYLEENIPFCLNDFIPLKNDGYDITYGTPIAKLELGEDALFSTITLPITLKVNDFTFKLEKFYVKADTYLKQLYETALSIFQKENAATFLEQFTLDQMIVYDQIPFSGVDFNCVPKTWTKAKVYQDLKDMLATNMPSLKIKGALYTLNNEFDKYYVISDVEVSKQTTISFLYAPDWPLLMDVLGENDAVLRGKPVTLDNAASQFTLPLFCLNDNHFVYDLKFPILITLSKEKDVFQFATQVIIDNNQPRENQFDIPDSETNNEICQYPNAKITVFALGKKADGSLQPLNDAKISIRCVDATCDLGTTKPEGSEYSLTTPAPACFNAKVIAAKDGFYQGSEFINTNTESTVSVILEPLYELNLDVQIQDTSLRPIQPTEQAIFTFTNQEKGYTTSVVYPGSTSLKLIEGNYQVESSLIVSSSSGLSIPDKEMELCVDAPRKGVAGLLGLQEKICKKETIKGMKVDQTFAGGGQYSWTISQQDLAHAQKITLYTVRGKVPSSIDDLMKGENALLQYSKIIKKPTLT